MHTPDNDFELTASHQASSGSGSSRDIEQPRRKRVKYFSESGDDDQLEIEENPLDEYGELADRDERCLDLGSYEYLQHQQDNTDSEQLCEICQDDDHDRLLLLCDRCDLGFHLFCVGLDSVPEGDWYCTSCRAKQGKYNLIFQLFNCY